MRVDSLIVMPPYLFGRSRRHRGVSCAAGGSSRTRRHPSSSSHAPCAVGLAGLEPFGDRVLRVEDHAAVLHEPWPLSTEAELGQIRLSGPDFRRGFGAEESCHLGGGHHLP